MMNHKMCKTHKVSAILLLVGGFNWGLIGLLEMDVIALLPGVLARIVYVLIGLAAVMMLMKHKCKACKVSVGEKKEEAPAMDAPSDAPQA